MNVTPAAATSSSIRSIQRFDVLRTKPTPHPCRPLAATRAMPTRAAAVRAGGDCDTFCGAPGPDAPALRHRSWRMQHSMDGGGAGWLPRGPGANISHDRDWVGQRWWRGSGAAIGTGSKRHSGRDAAAHGPRPTGWHAPARSSAWSCWTTTWSSATTAGPPSPAAARSRLDGAAEGAAWHRCQAHGSASCR